MMLLRHKSGAIRRRSQVRDRRLPATPLPLVVTRAVLAMLVFALLLATGRGLLVMRDAPVTELRVFGASGSQFGARGISAQQVRSMLAGQMDRGFWQLDLPAIQAMLESHDWVRKASVHREWPDTLRVQIDEQLPVARWNASHVLASSGELIEVRSLVEFIDLPQLVTPGEGAHSRREIVALVNEFNRLQKMLAPQGLSIRELGSAMGSDIWLVVDGDTRIELGNRDHETRLARLIGLVETGVIASWHSIEHADMRYGAGLAVRWRTPADAPAGAKRALQPQAAAHSCITNACRSQWPGIRSTVGDCHA